MQSVSNANFGPLIAYLVPGATALFGLSQFSPTLQSWFAVTPANVPTIGGFLYLTIASLAAGMTVSAIRWAVVDTVNSVTGLPPPTLDFGKLGRNVEAYSLLIEIHYRHYLYYSNGLIATAFAYACYRLQLADPFAVGWLDLGVLVLEVIFIAASRNTIRRYYARSEQLLGTRLLEATNATA